MSLFWSMGTQTHCLIPMDSHTPAQDNGAVVMVVVVMVVVVGMEW
jgi:hypothetical protein